MKALYWKTRAFRRSPQGARRVHWPGLACNVALAFGVVALGMGLVAFAGLDADFAGVFTLAGEMAPIIVAGGLTLSALGLGYRLVTPLDRLPDDQGAPPVERVSRWFHWATLRAALFGVLAACTMQFLCFTVSAWSGRAAWEAYRSEAAGRGVVFELEKLMPPKVPDEQNFAATPLLRPRRMVTGAPASSQSGIPASKDEAPMNLHERGVRSPDSGNWLLGQREDLGAWQARFRNSTNFPKADVPQSPAEDVLTALTRWDAEIAELRAAVARPKTWFDIRLTEDGISTTMPNLLAIRVCVPVVQLRAQANLAAGRGNAALADGDLALHLGDTLKDEPFLVAHVVRLAVYSVGLRTLWEGLADHRWSDAQLAHWQAELANRDFAAELRLAMAGERAFGERVLEFLTRRPELLPAISGPDPGNHGGPGYHLIPSGWFFRERINYHRAFDSYIVAALPADARRFDAARIQASTDAMFDDIQRNKRPIKSVLQHRVMTYLLLPALHKTMQRTCQAQVMTQLAIAACALERHRLARGTYPDSLAALAPEFAAKVATDPMSGRPFGYERTADGRFRLWSIAWNGKDDGGATVTRAPARTELDLEQGDWVWPVPAN